MDLVSNPRKVCRELHNVPSRDVIADMTELMLSYSGVGLAAPQVGIWEKFFIAQGADQTISLYINPQIILSSNTKVRMGEGCLSLPNRSIAVPRCIWVTVDYRDELFNRCVKTFTDASARIIQHEIDHLYARLIDRYGGE